MSTPDIFDFLEETETRLRAIVNGASSPIVFHTDIVPFLDIEEILKIPRWPAGIIVDGNGTFNEFNRDLWDRTFSVALIHAVPRSQTGRYTLKDLWARSRFLIDGLSYKTAGISVWNASDGEVDAILHKTDLLMYVMKSFTFHAKFDRGA